MIAGVWHPQQDARRRRITQAQTRSSLRRRQVPFVVGMHAAPVGSSD